MGLEVIHKEAEVLVEQQELPNEETGVQIIRTFEIGCCQRTGDPP
jgi:hypothetical protein